MRARSVIAFVAPLALVLSCLPWYALAEEVDSHGGQDESRFVQVSEEEGQGEASEALALGASGDSGSPASDDSGQDEDSHSSLVSVSPLSVSGGFSGGSSTGGGFSSTGWRVTDDGMADNMRFLYRMLGYSVSGNGVVSTNGSGILGVLVRLGVVLQSVSADTGEISNRLVSEGVSAATYLNQIASRVGEGGVLETAISSLGGDLSSINNRLVSEGTSAATYLNQIASRVGPGGTLDNVLSSINNRLVSQDTTVATFLNQIASRVGEGGVLETAISSLDSRLVSEGTNAATFLNQIASRLGEGGLLDSSLSAIYETLSSVNNRLVSQDTTVATFLNQIASRLSSTGVIAELLRQLGSDSASGFESVSEAVDSLTDVVRGLDLSPEVTVDVEGQTEQGLNLLDALLGVLDVAAIASSLSALSSTLQGSFPFGALFMVASALSVLSASPVAPCFSGSIAGVPIEIDLSPFDSVAALCRGLLLVLYVIGLYHATRDWVFRSGGGDS